MTLNIVLSVLPSARVANVKSYFIPLVGYIMPGQIEHLGSVSITIFRLPLLMCCKPPKRKYSILTSMLIMVMASNMPSMMILVS